ncbi:MAG: DinB family protein [Dehalococcoidia bacterium]
MTTEQGPSKAELLEALRTSERYVLDKLQALPEEEFEQGRYENGWNGRQILAHVASIEWTYPRLVDLAKGTAQPSGGQPASAPPAAARPTAIARGGIIDYNERQVEKRADASVTELVTEFQQNRAATIAAVEGTNDALLSKEIRSAGGIQGTLGSVINAVAVLHVIGHTNDITGA